MKAMMIAAAMAVAGLSAGPSAPPPALDWAYSYIPAQQAIDDFPHKPIYTVPEARFG